MSGRNDVGSVFAPGKDVLGLVGQGVSADVAAYACAQYYRLCATTGGGNGGDGVFYLGGRNADGHWVGSNVEPRFRVLGTGDVVVDRVGGSNQAGGVDAEVGVGARVDGNVCSCGAAAAGGSVDSGESERAREEGLNSGKVEEVPEAVVVVPQRTLLNREKRRKAKAAKQRKRAAAGAGETAAIVPEWRRKEGVGFHKGVFSECSEETQLALRESRAKMLIAKNKAAVIEAEERERKTAAMLKSRMIEENVEKERLELEKKMKVLRESAVMPQGYCETVLSALATPTLSDGTISPDSSISSAEVHKKDEAIKMLVNQCDEQRKKSEKTELALQEMSRKLEEFRLSSEKARKEKEDLIRERVRKERENMFAGRHGDGVKAAYESGKREYRGDDGTKIFWNTNADV